MRKGIVFSGCLAVFISASLCLADNGQEDGSDATTADEIVITATRQEERISSVPANVSVITEPDIENSTAYDLPDLLRKQTGVHVNDITGNRRSYTVDLRGFGETAPLNTLVLVDGRRINQADLSGSDWKLIPLERIKRIEIIRGGRGSVLYGDNASGGVINIITKEGEEFHAGAEVNGGSYSTFTGGGYVSGAHKRLSYALSGSYLRSDGYRDNSDTDVKDLGLNLDFYQSDAFKWNLSSGFHGDWTGLPGAIKANDFDAGTSRTDTLFPDDFAEVEDYYFEGGPEVYFLNNSTFKIDLSFRKRNSLSFASFDAGTFTGETEIDTISVSPQVIFKEVLSGIDNRLTVGFDFTDSEEYITNSSVFFGTPSVGIFELEKKNFGVYFHEEIRPLEVLAISGGYRYDHAEFNFKPSDPESRTMSEHLFTTGITYNYIKESSVYASFSRSFRFPVLDEQFSFFTNTIDTTLVPQTSDNFEIGIRHSFAEILAAGINVFHIDTENEILYNPNSFVNENLDGTVRRYGVELSVSGNLEMVTLSGNYTFTDAAILDGQYENKNFPNIPRHKAAIGGILTPGKGFSLSVDGIYVGKRTFISDFTNDFTEQQDDYFVLNAKFKYQREMVTLFINIKNLTNTEYSEYAGISTYPITEPGFFPSPKINLLAGMSVDF